MPGKWNWGRKSPAVRVEVTGMRGGGSGGGMGDAVLVRGPGPGQGLGPGRVVDVGTRREWVAGGVRWRVGGGEVSRVIGRGA